MSTSTITVTRTAPESENAAKAEWNRNRNRTFLESLEEESLDNLSGVKVRVPLAPIVGFPMADYHDVREVVQHVTSDLIAGKRVPLRLAIVTQKNAGDRWMIHRDIATADQPTRFAPLCIIRESDGTIRTTYALPESDGLHAYIRKSGNVVRTEMIRIEDFENQYRAAEIVKKRTVIRSTTAPVNVPYNPESENVTTAVVTAEEKRSKKQERDAAKLEAWLIRRGYVTAPESE